MSHADKEIYEFSDFRLDVDDRLLLKKGVRVALPEKAFEILCLLIRQSGRLIGKGELLEKAWAGAFVEENNLDKNISYLRQALGERRKGRQKFIETVRGRGYRFVADARRVNDFGLGISHSGFQNGSGQPTTNGELTTKNQKSKAEDQKGKPKSQISNPKSNTVAVLPFKTIDVASDDRYLGLGLADALIVTLSKIGGLQVRPTASVARFAVPSVNALDAGRELDVAFVLDGKIHKTGETLSATLQLIRIADEALLWAERFDGTMPDVFRLATRISAKIAQTLAPRMTGEERGRLAEHGTRNPAAYEAFLRGRYFWNQFVPESFPKALESFQLAVALDPNYAQAYAAIAEFYNSAGVFGVSPPAKCVEDSKAAARRALEIDESLSEAYAALGFVTATYERNWAEGERLYRRALEFNPNDSLAHEWLASLLLVTGRVEEWREEISYAENLNPLSPRTRALAAWQFYQARFFTEAIAKARRLIEFDKNFSPGYTQLGNILEQSDQSAEAVSVLRHSLQLTPHSGIALYQLCFAHAADGQPEKARAILDEMKTLRSEIWMNSYFLAMARVAVGEDEKAFELFEQAFDERDPWLFWIGVEPKLDRLRGDSRFEDLMRRMNYPPVAGHANSAMTIAADSQTSAPKTASIAVLPFKPVNFAAAGEDEYLGAAFADGLITNLSKTGDSTVRPTASVMPYSALEADPLEVGRELKVEIVVDGKIKKIGEKLRITVRAISVADDALLWAEIFDGAAEDIFALEDEISTFAALKLQENPDETTLRRLNERGTKSPAAYQAYLKARFHFHRGSPEDWGKSRFFYYEAVRLDPNYGRAYAGLVNEYIAETAFYSLNPQGVFLEIEEAVRKAVELDSTDAEVCAALANFNVCFEYNLPEAERNARKAVELNPSSAGAYNLLGQSLMFRGFFAGAETALNRALELDPLTPWHHCLLSVCHFLRRDYERAVERNITALALNPKLSIESVKRCWSLTEMGKYAEALALYDEILSKPGGQFANWFIGYTQAVAGESEKARAVLAELKKSSAETYISPYFIALVHAGLKETTEAVRCLEQAFESRDPWTVWIYTDPRFDNLRPDSRFQQLANRLLLQETRSNDGRLERPNFAAENLASLPERVNRNGEKFKTDETAAPEATVTVGNANVNADSNQNTLADVRVSAIEKASPTVKENSKSSVKPKRRPALIAAISLIALAGFGYGVYKFNGDSERLMTANAQLSSIPPPLANVEIRRLTTESRNFHPSISPDGKYLAYVLREEGEKESVWLKNIAAGSTVQIMPSAGGYGSLIFSPDGNYLYFGTSDGIIVRIGVFGGTPQEVARGHGGHFAVSPDGKQLAFPRPSTKPEESQSLVVVDTETGEEKAVVKRADGEKDEFYFHGWGATPSWSPDGAKIAVCGGKRGETGEWRQVVFEIRASDGAMREIPAPRWAATYQVAWLADGASLLVVAREKEAAPHQIWHLAYPSGEARRVTNDLHDYGKLSLTADSRALVATQETRTSNIWVLPDGDTNRARQLTFGTGVNNGDFGMAWTPDGRIVFASNRNGATQQLWTMNAAGDDLRQLTTEANGGNRSPKVSPDGRHIVFVSTRTGKSNIWRMDIDGHNHVRLTDGADDNRPSISPDGRWIYYTGEGDAPSAIAKVSIDGGAPVKLTSGFNAYAPVVSPDGKLISYIHFEDAVGWRRGIIRAEGGEPFKLLEIKAFGNLVWTLDSKSLIYIKGGMLSSNLFRQAVEGDAAPEQITFFKDDRMMSLAYSPDFKQLAITRGNHYSDIVLISNFR